MKDFKNIQVLEKKKLFIRPNWVEVDITDLDFEKDTEIRYYQLVDLRTRKILNY